MRFAFIPLLAVALSASGEVAPDEALFRRAEESRAAGRTAEAIRDYTEVFTRYTNSTHATQARFLSAMGHQGLERHRLLVELDSDGVELATRTAALYHLGAETSDTAVLEKCVRLDPKGQYAPYANLRYGTLLNASDDPVLRRKGLEVLLGLAFGDSALAEEALYLAAIQSYREKRYDEAKALFLRYRKSHPEGEHAAEALSMSAWCEFLEGRTADAAALCAEGESDDLAYIRAACAYSTGDNETALRLFRKYLADYPQGAYRADVALPVARLESDAGEVAYLEAMACVREGDWLAAEKAFAAVMETETSSNRTVEAMYWRGVASMKIGRGVEGSGFLENAVAAGLGPDESREARLMVADYDYRCGRTEQARRSYAKLVRDGACDHLDEPRILAFGRFVGGAEAEICARALARSEDPEWRQTGWALLGDCETKRGDDAAAIEAYRKCLAEPAKTASAASAALPLGRLEFRVGEFDKADLTLKKAIELNAADDRVRAEAYVLLAKNAGAKGDWKSAVAYATVVTSVFDEAADLCTEAKAIIDSSPPDNAL